MTTALFVERRKTCRIDQNFAAHIRIRNGEPIPCSVRNISSMGAFLELKEPVMIPPHVKLVIPEHWFEADCEARHVSVTGIGVLFTSNRREALARFA